MGCAISERLDRMPLFNAARIHERGASCFGRSHSTPDAIFNLELQMNTHLLIHVPLGVTFREQKSQSTNAARREFEWRHASSLQHEINRCRKVGPLLSLGCQLLSARGCERVELCTTPLGRHAPLRTDPALIFETVQCRIKGTLIYT